jgi:hypothetical protein
MERMLDWAMWAAIAALLLACCVAAWKLEGRDG